MKKLAATRTLPDYDPESELTRCHPEWQLTTAPPGALTMSWMSFNPHRKVVAVRPDVMASPDQMYAIAFAVAMLDLGAVHEEMAGIDQKMVHDAEGLAMIRLGHPMPWATVGF